MVSDQAFMMFISLLFEVSALILIMFLPALLELKKQKDVGSRNISENVSNSMEALSLKSIEKEEKRGLDTEIAKKISEIIAFLPNMES